MSFYIQKIIVTGLEKTDSVIELSNGLNIIYGPSNTGKTYIVKCIDYMFGYDKEPIDISMGYQHIEIIVKTMNGILKMKRKIGENKIQVDSTDSNISSGKYSTKASQKNYDKTINSVWLSLIGINEMHLVIKNENYNKQILSWRTFSHMFMLTETKIISGHSVILSEHKISNTAEISSLIFLLSGQDFSETESKDSKEIKEAKKNAIKEYINKELFKLSERNQKLLNQLEQLPNVDIETEMKEIIANITKHEKMINDAINKNQEILAQLYKKNESLSECNILLDRYNELTTQYTADLKRLSFIVDGEVNYNKSLLTKCPFCDSKVTIKENHNYIEAAKFEYKKIKMQAKDLENALQALIAEKDTLEREIKILIENRESTEKLIELKLKPQLDVLSEKLLLYKMIVERKKEIDILKELVKQKQSDIIKNELNEESELKFKVREHIDYNFINILSNDVFSFLKQGKYSNLLTVTFEKASMDIIINGKKKSSNGKGYNAYFNSVVAIILSRYMKEQAKYSPNFLVLDSPILSLREEMKKPSETMRYSLFENIVRNQNGIQTIIIENEIPDIDYKNTNIIHFTKEKNNGRYGFLMDITN